LFWSGESEFTGSALWLVVAFSLIPVKFYTRTLNLDHLISL
jgi:hypothetical protein